MSDIDIKRLRVLRERVEELFKNLIPDLRPFRHKNRSNGFIRTPKSSSDPDDVNITTSCSCILALALTGKFEEFYSDENLNIEELPTEMFRALFKAPWMSSGLSENNAFTTTLVLRALGFLIQSGVPKISNALKEKRWWEPHIQFQDGKFVSFAKELSRADEEFSVFVFSLFSRKTQNIVKQFLADGKYEGKTSAVVTRELERIIGTTVLYEKTRCSGFRHSAEGQKLIDGTPDGYSVARLNRWLIHDRYRDSLLELKEWTPEEIAEMMSADEAMSLFKINDYAPSAAVIYWFIDGVSRAGIKLPDDNWKKLCSWAASEFNRQRSLVLAQHEAMMDPVSMGMAACLCSKLRELCKNKEDNGMIEDHLESLPSRPELEHSIKELFKYLTNGIWPKYFPLFHYQDAGSNFCFTFELLEAVIVEFGRHENELADDVKFIKGLEDAITWCKSNRHESKLENPCCGWNSGGYLETLKKSEPESWPTAVVHMFLWELSHLLSTRIQKALLKRYKSRKLNGDSKVANLIDIEIFEKGATSKLTDILTNEIVKKYTGQTEKKLRIRKLKGAPRSALLFGPPGTSKTTVTDAVAGDLGWELIQIDPSHFLAEGLDGIYLQAEKIFTDLMDLSGVVVLFDEMDALVQTRDSDHRLDTTAQFLTTYMLPKLTALHDRGRVLFFMATNFQERFDPAIKRAGRFDLLLCMGPPLLDAKLAALGRFCDERPNKFATPAEKAKAAALIATATELFLKLLEDAPRLKVQLELYTYGDFKTFVKKLGSNVDEIIQKLSTMKSAEFQDLILSDSEYAGLRIDELAGLQKKDPKYENWKSISDLDHLDIDRKNFTGAEITPVIRYLLDRRESRHQD